jgi:hypothetical protein
MNFTLLIVALVAVILAIAWGRQRLRTGVVAGCFRRQEEKRGGRVRPANLFRFPQLSLPTAGGEVLVSAVPGGSRGGVFISPRPPHTFAQVPVEAPAGTRLDIQGRAAETARDRALGAAGIVTGDGRFDDRFLVKCSDEDFARALLDDEVRRHLLAFAAADGLHVTVDQAGAGGDSRCRLDLSITRITGDDDDYDRLIEAALALRERLARIA